MCLAVPGRILSIEGEKAVVDYKAEKRTARLLDDTLTVGDYVIVQGGYCVIKVEREEAERALEAYAASI